jgi:hypothetical protein
MRAAADPALGYAAHGGLRSRLLDELARRNRRLRAANGRLRARLQSVCAEAAIAREHRAGQQDLTAPR